MYNIIRLNLIWGNIDMEKNNDFFIRSIFRTYLIPSILALLGTTITVLIDSIIIGNFIGEKGLAALNLVKPVYFTFMTLGSLISVGAAANASVYIGKEDRKSCDNMASLALILSLAAGLLVTIPGLVFLPEIVHGLGAREDLYQMAYDYAFVMMSGGVSVVLMYFPFNFLRVSGRPRMGVVMFMWMAVLNVVLDLVLLLVFQLGMGGMAFASVLSTAIADIAGFLFLRFPNRCFPLKKPFQVWKSIKEIVVTGSSMALNNFCNIIRTMVLNWILFRAFGNDAITAFAMTATVGSFITAVISGVSQTITPLIGVFYGEKDNTSIRTTMKMAFQSGIGMILAVTMVLVIFPQQICRLFGIQEGDVLGICAAALVGYAVSLVFSMINNIFIFLFFTTGRNLLANVVTFFRAFGFVTVFAMLFSGAGYLMGVWSCFILAEAAAFLVMLMWVGVVRIKNNKFSGLYLLDQTYEDKGKYLSFSVPNEVEEAVNASVKINTFCKENRLDGKTAMMLSLSLEEMLVIIFDHCFEENEMQYVDIRIFVMPGTVVLRMRNGGKIFDPVLYYEKKKEQAGNGVLADDSLGIRLIVKKAEQVSFNRTFGVNNLTIVIKTV